MGRCVRSPNYPNQYTSNGACQIRTTGAGTLSVKKFDTERKYDTLTVGAKAFSGTTGPTNVKVTSTTAITWKSDRSMNRPGFEICLVSATPALTAPGGEP